MIDFILDNLILYKTKMTFKGVDFQADSSECYPRIREKMVQ